VSGPIRRKTSRGPAVRLAPASCRGKCRSRGRGTAGAIRRQLPIDAPSRARKQGSRALWWPALTVSAAVADAPEWRFGRPTLFSGLESRGGQPVAQHLRFRGLAAQAFVRAPPDVAGSQTWMRQRHHGRGMAAAMSASGLHPITPLFRFRFRRRNKDAPSRSNSTACVGAVQAGSRVRRHLTAGRSSRLRRGPCTRAAGTASIASARKRGRRASPRRARASAGRRAWRGRGRRRRPRRRR
jgi:hypothetical protein